MGGEPLQYWYVAFYYWPYSTFIFTFKVSSPPFDKVGYYIRLEVAKVVDIFQNNSSTDKAMSCQPCHQSVFEWLFYYENIKLSSTTHSTTWNWVKSASDTTKRVATIFWEEHVFHWKLKLRGENAITLKVLVSSVLIFPRLFSFPC